jgi:hypothetical protein
VSGICLGQHVEEPGERQDGDDQAQEQPGADQHWPADQPFGPRTRGAVLQATINAAELQSGDRDDPRRPIDVRHPVTSGPQELAKQRLLDILAPIVAQARGYAGASLIPS